MSACRLAQRPDVTVGVTGVPRGGSMVAASLLHDLGVSLESDAFRKLNAELQFRLGGAWDQPPVLEPDWEHDTWLDPLRSRAARVAENVLELAASRGRAFAYEDSQLALLLPFWQTVMPIDTTIVLVRDPVDVMSSLRASYGLDVSQAALLWLRYLLSATTNDPGHLLVRYDELTTDSSAAVAAISQHLGLPEPPCWIEASAREHVDGTLFRETARAGALPADESPLVALAGAVWDDGAIDLAALPPPIADGIRRGWFRAPTDGELLARARARVMHLRERVRRHHRAEIQERKQHPDRR